MGSGFTVLGSRFWVHSSGFTVQGSRFRVHGSQFTVHSSLSVTRSGAVVVVVIDEGPGDRSRQRLRQRLRQRQRQRSRQHTQPCCGRRMSVSTDNVKTVKSVKTCRAKLVERRLIRAKKNSPGLKAMIFPPPPSGRWPSELRRRRPISTRSSPRRAKSRPSDCPESVPPAG